MNHGDTEARRDGSEQADHHPFDNPLHSNVPVPAWWISRLEQMDDFLDAEVAPEQVRTLAVSPGGRAVRATF